MKIRVKEKFSDKFTRELCLPDQIIEREEKRALELIAKGKAERAEAPSAVEKEEKAPQAADIPVQAEEVKPKPKAKRKAKKK